MPTGVHIRDARRHLFDAARRVLLRDGADALTSRAVTDEAGVAKGVLHRHFDDFDAFLVELVRDRVDEVEAQVDALRRSAGTATVTGNVAAALTDVFDAVAVAVLRLVIFRDPVRARLRPAGSRVGIPVLSEACAGIAAYLADEREMGRIAADADVDALALSLVGTGHMLFTGRPEPDAPELERVVSTVLADVVQRRLL